MASILCLDDEPNVVSALRRTLRRPLGELVTLECFTDPHAALTRIGEHRFDLVMSDFRMPLMDGVQFLRFVRELQPSAVRMIVSASTEISGVMSAINEVGVFRYVVKPWTTDLLIEDVQSALEHSATLREQHRLAEAMRLHSREVAPMAAIDPIEAERRRLEELEPGLTHVNWGPNGEVLMPTLPMALD
jgi:two-component system probable response regulator PhcQ